MCEIALCPRECRPRFFLLSHDVVLDLILALDVREEDLVFSPPISICMTVSFLVFSEDSSQLCVLDAGKIPSRSPILPVHQLC